MSDSGNITAALKELIQAYVGDGSPVTETTDLVEELGLTSLQVMEFIERVEERYDISYPLNDLANVRTLADLARGIEQQMGT